MKIIYIAFLLFCFKSFSQEQFTVFFDSNKFELTKNERNHLEQWMTQNKEVKIIAINGFCDEDGTTGYNDTLAKKRIDFVFHIIEKKLKIRDDFKSLNFGELRNVSKLKSENRKVTLFYITPKDFEREDEILGLKKRKLVFNGEEIKSIKFPEKLNFQKPDGTTETFKMDTVFMQKLYRAKIGEKLKLENLNFIINTFAVTPESRGKMYELLFVLNNNPGLKIQIQGHLCCMPNDRLDLSTQRAKAIYNFLINNHIDKSRLSYMGYGSSHPLFPLPEKDEAQRAANRRVEIEITSNEY